MKNIKLRYYLRGLGIGVLVTAFIMGTTGKGEGTMTDAQIRERASELGMVDGGSLVLSDLRDTTEDAEPETSENITENNTEESEQGLPALPQEPTDVEETESEETDVQTAEGEGAQTSQEAETTDLEIPGQTEPVAEPETGQPEETPSDGASEEKSAEVTGSESRVEDGIAYFEIVYGENSNRVSRVLAELGLVADAAAFDNYLCSNGYSKRIHTGNYAIAIGTDEEEIAKIITGNR